MRTLSDSPGHSIPGNPIDMTPQRIRDLIGAWLATWLATVLVAGLLALVSTPAVAAGTTLAQDSAFVSQTVPASLTPGQVVSVSVTMKNTGSNKWTAATNYRLGSQDPTDNTIWGTGRVALPTSVLTGQSVTFSFSIKAPTVAGTYAFRWKMVQDGVAWFGVATPSVPIVVAAPNTPPTVSLTAPTSGLVTSAPASLFLTADAADVGGSIASVSFWSNGTLLGTDTSAPYGWALNSLSAGSYQLKAVATDNAGLTTTSATVGVIVNASSTVSAVRSYVYDAYERLCKTINPESGATIVDYDAAGNIAWTVEGVALVSTVSCDRESVLESQRVYRQYDSLNRPVAVITPDGNANLEQSYNADGSVKTLSVLNPGGFKVTTNYAYNKRGLLVSESSTNGSTLFGLLYGYDGNGSLSSLTYPDNHVVAFAPDGLGRARRISGTGGVVYADEITYAPHGAIRRFKYGNGIVHTMEANARLLPTRSRDVFSDATGTSVVLDDEYAFDPNGNVTDITDRAQNGLTTRGMAYDPLDRLTAAVSPLQWGNAIYAYDALDNLRIADQGARQYRYNYDASNRLASIRSPAGATLITLGYDSHGNTTSKNGQGFVFDAVNRMSQVTGVQAYRYDGLGRRAQTTDADGKTTFWIYGQSGQVLYTSEARRSQNLAYIYLGNTQVATRAVAWGTGTTTVRYQHTDALGSPVAETDASHAVVKRNSYAPYGEAFGTTVIDGTGYTGHVMDRGTGLTYMQQRYYDPQVARFLSRDPVGVRPGDGGNFNAFKYAGGNPFRFVDPDGRYEEDVHRDLTLVLARAAGAPQSVANEIASADQGVDDNPATSPMGMSPTGRPVEVRAAYHFTTPARRGHLFRRFLNSGRASDMGVYLHARQDSHSHRGYGPTIGHSYAGHTPDKTFNNVDEANAMAQETYNTILNMKDSFTVDGKPVQWGPAVPWKTLAPLVRAFNAARTEEAKKAALEKIRAALQ